MGIKGGNGLLREEEFPTIFCSGCGHGVIVNAVTSAIKKLNLNPDDVIAVSGIGCSSRAPAYIDCNSIQTTHGRAITFATGMKMQRPDMHVILFLGDGDGVAIGGNHFIHAARRNIDLTVIIMNNNIYGMTGGQTSPTTNPGDFSTTSPFGNIEPSFNICSVAIAAGATFVAKSTAYHAAQLATQIEKGIQNKGFSVIECISPCPTGYGRRNNMKNPVEMYEQLRDNSISLAKSKELSNLELKDKHIIGIYKDEDSPEFVNTYMDMVESISEKKAEYQEGLMIQENEYVKELDRYEIRLSGTGGQGLILGGIIFSEAAIMEGLNVIQSQSYGTEARGGASRAEIILSQDEIYFPEVTNPDILLSMSQQACDKFISSVKDDGLVIIDSTFVKDIPETKAKILSLPITQLTIDKFGTSIMSNVLALGVIAKLTNLISIENLEKAVGNRVPSNSLDINIQALRIGYNEANSLVEEIVK